MATNAQGKPASGDFTGSQKAKLEEQHAAERAIRASELATISAADKQAASTETLDVTKNPALPTVVDEVSDVTAEPVLKVAPRPVAPKADEVSLVEDVEGDGIVVRFNEDLQQVTIGDRVYDFIAGRKYKVPRNVAFHLEEQGKIWH